MNTALNYYVFDSSHFFLSLQVKSIHTIFRMNMANLHLLIDIRRCQTPDFEAVSLHFYNNLFVNGVSPCA